MRVSRTYAAWRRSGFRASVHGRGAKDSEGNFHHSTGARPGLRRPKLERAFHFGDQRVDDREPQAARLPPIEPRREPSPIVADLHPEPPIKPAGDNPHFTRLVREAMLDGVLAEFADDHRQAGGDIRRQQTEAALTDCRDSTPRGGDVADRPEELIGYLIEFDDLIEGLRQGFVHNRNGGDP